MLRESGPLAAVLLVLAVAGIAVGGALALKASQDKETVVGTAGGSVPLAVQPTTDVEPPIGATPTFVDPTPAPAPAEGESPPSSEQPEPTPEPTTAPAAPSASADIDDATIESAMAEAAAAPLVGLPSRNEIATVRMVDQLVNAGHDLTDIEFSIYPASSADSFVLIETSDSSPLLASEEGETFILDLLESPILAEYEVERLVLQHTGVDEQGPALITMTVLISEFQNAVDTGSDVISSFAVQVERR